MRHCHLYPLYSWQDILLTFIEMELDNTTMFTPSLDLDSHSSSDSSIEFTDDDSSGGDSDAPDSAKDADGGAQSDVSSLISAQGGQLARIPDPPPLGTLDPPPKFSNPSFSNLRFWRKGLVLKVPEKKSPRREVVRSSAGAGVIYPPFWGSFA